MEAISTKYVCLQYRVFLKRLANVSTNCNGEFSVNYVKKKKKIEEIKTSREERSGAAVVCYFIASEIRCG